MKELQKKEGLQMKKNSQPTSKSLESGNNAKISGQVTKTLIFDIETDNLLLDVKNFWVGVTYCIETKEIVVYRDATKLCRSLQEADTIVGHNIIGYDIPVLFKLTGIDIKTEVVDTLLLAKLVYYDKDKGWGHSLDAYGERLGEKKGNYNDWSKYTAEMEKYCIQDVKVTQKLYAHLKRKATWLPKEAIELEQEVQRIVTKQYINGWKFDEKKAKALHIELVQEKEEAEQALWATFEPKFLPDGKIKTPKRPFRRMGVSTVGPHQPIKLRVFNPGSGNHVVWWVESFLGKQKWVLTDKGSPKTDAETLKEMFEDSVFLKPLLHYLEVNKLLGMVADGSKAWLKLVRDDGRIHGGIDILGAVSGRATHSSPNMSQVPSIRSYKGKESRDLFIVDKGEALVGCDLSGVELRCLAHFLHPYDKGRYADIIMQGDIHTANQKAAGLPTRDQAKTFCYGVIYGAGDAKIGEIVGGTAKEGKKLKANFFKGTPGYLQLTQAVSKAAKKRWLRGITGRRLRVRSPHSALNVLLQSLGSYISKYWMVEFHRVIEEEGIVVSQLGWSHDEINVSCKESDSEKVAKILEQTSISACENVGIRMPIESESKIGRSWLDVH